MRYFKQRTRGTATRAHAKTRARAFCSSHARYKTASPNYRLKRNNAQHDCAVWIKRGEWLGAREGYGGLKPPFMYQKYYTTHSNFDTSRPANTKRKTVSR